MFTFRSLASGSSGNAFLLRTEKVNLLFDAGIPTVRLVKYLHAEGIDASALAAVLVSHEHRDHCGAVIDLARAHGLPVCANPSVLRAIGAIDLPQAQVVDVGQSARFGDVQVSFFPVVHDSVCPVGFLVEVEGRTISIATDLGNCTPEVSEAVKRADLIVLEANHDLDMLHSGRYPYHLRKRVSGPKGHLSNGQAGGILASNVRSDDREVWLAHLSKENNTQALALKTVRASLRAAGLAGTQVQVALRDRPSLRWTGHLRPRQLSLFSGMELR